MAKRIGGKRYFYSAGVRAYLQRPDIVEGWHVVKHLPIWAIEEFARGFGDMRWEHVKNELPRGISEEADGTFHAECRGCGKWFDLEMTREQAINADPYYFLCGGSDRCCP